MTKDSAIKVAKKLKALAERAVGPEAESARAKLYSYCIKHNIDPADYDTKITDVFVEYSNEQERKILNNIITMILQSNKVEAEVKIKSIHFKCTEKQFKNINEAYSHYKKIYYTYADALTIALIAKNKIQCNKTSDDRSMDYEMSPEEREEFEKIKKDLEAELNLKNPEPVEEPRTESPNSSTLSQDKQKEIIEKFLFVMDESPWSPANNSGLFLN
jgi:hypothetical protein